jgi:hypothetical protein
MHVLILAVLLAAAPALSVAQTAPPAASNPVVNNPNDKLGLEQPPGLGALNKPKDQIRVEENSAMPEAGAAGPSAAPTMALDCQKNPRDCSEPVISTGSVPPPNLPQQSK